MLEIFLALIIPLGLDLYLPAPAANRPTPDKIESGRRLFFDRRLSRDGSIACSTCHRPDRAFTNGTRVAVGIDGRSGNRNVPAIINRGYSLSFFWDGRVTTLEEQVLRPIEDPAEMGFSAQAAAERVGLSRDDLANALASYVRSILSGNSRFDAFVAGDRAALSTTEQRGLDLFRTKARCTLCHIGPTLSDERFHNTGIAWSVDRATYLDDGRYLVTKQETDRGRFKTPTLRDVALSAPYMHDGSLATLEEVVDFYDGGGRPHRNLDPNIRPLKLTGEEKASLVAFLNALTGRR